MRLPPALARLRPRTLFTQMVLLLGIAVCGAKVGSFYVLMEDRAFAVQQMHVNDTIARMAAAFRLITAAPDTSAMVLEAANSREFRFQITDYTRIDPAAMTQESREAAARLQALLGPDAREVRVKILRAEEDEAATPDGLAAVAMKVSILLPDGYWLNAATHQVINPPGYLRAILISTLISVLVVSLAAFFIARRIAQPLRDLAMAAERLGRGENVEALNDTDGPQEVRRTAAAFNAMKARLRRFVADRTRMLAAVSHDLRTPITNLRLRVEMLEDAEARERMLATLDELRQTAETMLALAREEAGEEPRPADLASLVDSVCTDLAESGQPVTCAPAEKIPIICRPVALRRIIRNLVENAVTYGGNAHVAVGRADGMLAVTIDDDGPGIADPDLERVFEPFVRLETSRSRRTGGAGLGLSIARSLAHAHGGDITLVRRPEGGLRATLRLPDRP